MFLLVFNVVKTRQSGKLAESIRGSKMAESSSQNDGVGHYGVLVMR